MLNLKQRIGKILEKYTKVLLCPFEEYMRKKEKIGTGALSFIFIMQSFFRYDPRRGEECNRAIS